MAGQVWNGTVSFPPQSVKAATFFGEDNAKSSYPDLTDATSKGVKLSWVKAAGLALNMRSILDQEQSWRNAKGALYALDGMSLRYKNNVMHWMIDHARRLEKLYRIGAQIERTHPGKDSDALSAYYEIMMANKQAVDEEEAVRFVRSTPLYTALGKHMLARIDGPID